MFAKGSDSDYDAFIKALGMLKLKSEKAAWDKPNFLQKTMCTDDVPCLKREIEKMRLEKELIASKNDKYCTLLSLKEDMEKESKLIYEKDLANLKMLLKASQVRAEEMARLADFRANRII